MIKLLSILIGSTFILEGCKGSIGVKTVARAAKSACNSLENPTCNKIAPAIDTISDQTINENVAIAEINGADSGDDLDSANTAITYTCYYDTTKDDAVADSTLCTALTGISFDTATGVMNWTPNYSQSGVYEFKITGSNGSLTDDEVFVITVNNVNTDTVVVNAAPALDAIADLTVNENAAMTAVDAGDGADDLDVDTQAITYTCYYDTASDGVVASTSLCSALTGMSFATGTGIMTWTPSYSQSGAYEFKITGSDGSLSDDEFFVVTVNNVAASPLLDAIADETVAENTAITGINAGDGGDDLDFDGQTISYTCYHDTTTSGTVANSTLCTALTGVAFNTTTGVMSWTPSYSQSGSYEFKITGSNGVTSDDEFFVITVTNVNRAPVLDAIADETVAENSAITAMNAGDGADDLDTDGEAITYTCYYDTAGNGVVANTTLCTALTGVAFNTSTGAMSWTPNYTQSGTYEFKITGSDGSLTDDEFFVVTVTNVNQAPVLDAVADETVAENSAMTAIDTGDGGDDLDADGQTITYTCYYDTASNGAVANTTLCTALTGVSFNTTTGAMSWTPSNIQSGTYEFKITGSDGTATDDEFFVITVTNGTLPPVLDAIADQTVAENAAMTAVNAGDGGNDLDADGDTVSYTCYYDTANDSAVANTTLCTALTVVSFNTTTGAMSWTPSYTQSGTYEFKITGSDGATTDDEFFVITVTNTNRAPVLDAFANQSVAENAAMTAVNAGDGADDADTDGDTITYTCYYDNTNNSTVANTNLCTAISGVSFDTSTGAMSWTPDYSQSGTYEIKITGSDTALTDDEFLVITVTNVNRAPVLDDIADETVNENVSITAVNAGDGADDADVDGTTITYTCYYDTTVSGTVTNTNLCTVLTGVSFTTATGAMSWTPSYTQSGTYEFKITGSDGSLTDTEFYVITVTDVNEPPTLSFTNPAGNDDSVMAGTNFEVAFTAVDSDNAATVSLYRKTSSTNCTDGSLTGWTAMTTTLTEGANSSYTMNTTGLDSTTQYICGKIDDSINAAAYFLSDPLTVTAYTGPPAANTSTSVDATASEPQRKTFYDTVNSRHWAFVYDGSAISYSYSTDNATWIAVSTIAYNTPNFHIAFRDVSGTGYVFLAVEGNTYDIELRRGTLSTTSVSFDAAVTVYDGTSTSDRYYKPTLSFDDSHYVWVTANHYDGNGYQIRAKDSVNIASGTLSSWNAAANVGKRTILGAKDAVIMPRGGNDMYIVANDAGAVVGYKYTASAWSEAMTGGASDWFNIEGESNIANGEIKAIVFSGNQIYVGGTFLNAGGNASADRIAYWNGTKWNALGSGLNSNVNAMATSGGNIYVAGDFIDVGGNSSADFVAYWDGANWNGVGAGIGSTVNAIGISGSNIYVAGSFTDAGGNTSADRVAYWNGTNWVAMGTGLGNTVHALEISGSNIYVGGIFLNAGGNASADRIAYWNGISWNALGTGLGNDVYAIAISGSNIYAGGIFTNAGANASADRIAYWDGTNWNPLGTGLSATVRSIEISGSNIYAGGEFTDAGGNASADSIAYWNGTNWIALGTGLGTVNTIAISGANIYAGGLFTDAGANASADYIAYWNGTSWVSLGSALGAGLTSIIRAIGVSGSNIYVGGEFTNVGGNTSADYIAYWNGTSWNALGTGLNSRVYALEISGSNVYAAGDFTDAGGNTSADKIAYWDGTNWNALGTGLNNYTYAIAISGSNIYAGGDFTDAGGNTSADKIAHWDGTSWNALGSGLNAAVKAIDISGANIFAGGDFTDAGGNTTADAIAYWDGTSWNALGSGVNSTVYAIATSGTNIYAGGYFTNAGGNTSADYIAYWDGTSWNALGSGVTNGVLTIEIAGTNIYAGGHFTDAGGNTSANFIAYWDGATWNAIGSGFNVSQVQAIGISGSNIYAANSNLEFRHYAPIISNSIDKFSAVSDSSGNIHLLTRSSTGISHKSWDGTTWSAATSLSATGSFPTLSYHSIANDLYGFFTEAGALKYKSFDMSSWSSATTLQAAGVYMPNCDASSGGGIIKCLWLENTTSSPYNIRSGIVTP